MKKPAWVDEFVAFAVKGNAMALAVGTIIGAAFSTITKTLTDDVIMPKMGTEFTAKHMSRVIATNVNDEKNPLVRLIPLPIKNAIMKAIFDSVGEKKACLTLSNLGQIKIPEIMQQYVERFDFILGVQAAAPYNCGMLSYGNTIYINFIRNIQDAELEAHFFGVLQSFGLPVTVESNRNER